MPLRRILPDVHRSFGGAGPAAAVQREFEDYLKCSRLEHGFLRVHCESCHAERLVAFSCKRSGFCPSCGARRMAESAALLVDEVLSEQPIRQWVLSFPILLRFLFASWPEIMGRVLGIVYRCIATHLIKQAEFCRTTAQTGAVTLIQRFSSALTKSLGTILNSRRRPRRGVKGRIPGITSTSTFICCFSMGCTSMAPRAALGFAGSRRRPVPNSRN